MIEYHMPTCYGPWVRVDTVEPDGALALAHPNLPPQPKETKVPTTGLSQVHGDLDATSYVTPSEPESVRIARQNRETNPNMIPDLAQDDEWFAMLHTTEAHAMAMKRRATHHGGPDTTVETRRTPERSEVFADGKPTAPPYTTRHVIRPEDDSLEDQAFIRYAHQHDQTHRSGRELNTIEQWRRQDRDQALADHYEHGLTHGWA